MCDDDGYVGITFFAISTERKPTLNYLYTEGSYMKDGRVYVYVWSADPRNLQHESNLKGFKSKRETLSDQSVIYIC
jgi:hypothetical protein